MLGVNENVEFVGLLPVPEGHCRLTDGSELSRASDRLAPGGTEFRTSSFTIRVELRERRENRRYFRLGVAFSGFSLRKSRLFECRCGRESKYNNRTRFQKTIRVTNKRSPNTPGCKINCASREWRRLRGCWGRRCRKHMTTIAAITMMPTRTPAIIGPAKGSCPMTFEFVEALLLVLEVVGVPESEIRSEEDNPGSIA